MICDLLQTSAAALLLSDMHLSLRAHKKGGYITTWNLLVHISVPFRAWDESSGAHPTPKAPIYRSMMTLLANHQQGLE